MDGFDVGHYYYFEGSLVSYLHMDLAVGFLFFYGCQEAFPSILLRRRYRINLMAL